VSEHAGRGGVRSDGELSDEGSGDDLAARRGRARARPTEMRERDGVSGLEKQSAAAQEGGTGAVA
jgi:hypothetical protein